MTGQNTFTSKQLNGATSFILYLTDSSVMNGGINAKSNLC